MPPCRHETAALLAACRGRRQRSYEDGCRAIIRLRARRRAERERSRYEAACLMYALIVYAMLPLLELALMPLLPLLVTRYATLLRSAHVA